MKNTDKNTNIIVGRIIFLMLLLTVFITQSCDTEIPPTDTDPPTFSFTITGDGFDHTFTQDDDFENFELYVKNNTDYHFAFVGADAGGLRQMEWHIEPSSNFELVTTIEEPWRIVREGPGSMWIRWLDTTSADATTGSFLTGDFRFPAMIQNNQSHTLNFWLFAQDFGGQSGPLNDVGKRLRIVITNQSTAIVDKLI